MYPSASKQQSVPGLVCVCLGLRHQTVRCVLHVRCACMYDYTLYQPRYTVHTSVCGVGLPINYWFPGPCCVPSLCVRPLSRARIQFGTLCFGVKAFPKSPPSFTPEYRTPIYEPRSGRRPTERGERKVIGYGFSTSPAFVAATARPPMGERETITNR